MNTSQSHDTPKRIVLAVLASAACVFATPRAAEAKDVKIKLGTLAPEGSPWHNSLKRMAQRAKEASNGQVNFTLYAGGVVGDEGDMVRKIRIGQLHAATITNIGLSRVTKASIALQVPMMIQSNEELDYVREQLGPKLKKEMESAGFVVLNWGDAGWAQFFSKAPATTPEEFRKMKLLVPSGDPDMERAWKAAKFNIVPLSATETLPSLQSGIVDAFSTTPLYALTAQLYAPAKNMLQVNWAPLSGATIVSKKQWEEIDPAVREKVLAIAEEEGALLRAEVRKIGDDAVKSMVERGLKVSKPDAAVVAEWQKAAELAHPELRGKVVPEAYFDEAKRLVAEFRAKKK